MVFKAVSEKIDFDAVKESTTLTGEALAKKQARDKEQVQTKEQAQKDNLDQQKANEAQLQNLQTELSATFTKHKATLANLSNEELEAIAARDGLVQEKER